MKPGFSLHNITKFTGVEFDSRRPKRHLHLPKHKLPKKSSLTSTRTIRFSLGKFFESDSIIMFVKDGRSMALKNFPGLLFRPGYLWLFKSLENITASNYAQTYLSPALWVPALPMLDEEMACSNLLFQICVQLLLVCSWRRLPF
jgi:hypothetical protein